MCQCFDWSLIKTDYILDVLTVFSQCAGLNINIDKTKAEYIGSLMSFDHFPHGLSWIETPKKPWVLW